MDQMPLFPLKTVLFPGAPLQLHIFEDRYKQMVDYCIREQQLFGVVLIREGVEALGPLAITHDVGCSARILNVQRLSHGRMNIVVLGQDRFRILSVDREFQPYLLGLVENLPFLSTDFEEMTNFGMRLRPQVERFIHRLVEAGGGKFDTHQLPDDPAALAFMACSILQISPAQKQNLLVIEELRELFLHLDALYRRELAILEITLNSEERTMQGSFSLN